MFSTITHISPNGHWQTPEGNIKYKHLVTMADGTSGTAYTDTADLGYTVGQTAEYQTKATKKGISISLNQNATSQGVPNTRTAYGSTADRDLMIARQTSVKAATDLTNGIMDTHTRSAADATKMTLEIAEVLTKWIMTGTNPWKSAQTPAAPAQPAQTPAAPETGYQPSDDDLPF